MQQFVFVVVRQEGRHRAEGFLVQQGVAGGLGEDHRRFDEAARALANLPAMDDLTALGARGGEQLGQFLLVRLVGHWAELGGLIQGGADLQLAQALGQRIEQRVDARAVDEEALTRCADLP
ncbi:hypothetical protein D3C76_382180 [compost metagenome]